MPQLRVLIVAPLLALAWACGPVDSATEPELGQLEAEIVGGTVDYGDPAVVALAQNYQGAFYAYCTGTLIGSKTVITAAHCVGKSGTAYAVFGTSVDAPTSSVQVAQQIAHPNYSKSSNNADIAVLRLASPVSGVTPIPVNTQPLSSSHIGLAIRHVGFGVTDAQGNGSGLKRQVTYAIRQVSSTQLESGATGKQTCQGDSGGPGFSVMPGTSHEVVTGIVSYGDATCLQTGYDTNVATYSTWVQNTMAAWEAPTCEDDGKCKAGCMPVDVDCACAADATCNPQCPVLTRDPDCPKDCVANGVCALDPCPSPDPDCKAEGQSCTTDLQCAWRKCVGDPQHAAMYCSRPCTDSVQCPLSGTECSGGACKWKQRPTATIGEACTAETYCLLGGSCNGPDQGALQCQLPCSGSGASCPGTQQKCELGTTGAWYCAEPVTQPADAGSTTPPPAQYVLVPRADLDRAPAASGCSSSGGAPLWLGAFAAGLMLLRRRRAALAMAAVVATVATGCGPGQAVDSGPTVGRAEQEIVGGTTDYEDPEVFMLLSEYANGTGSTCTATLIGLRTLVTAAHCVDDPGNTSLVRVYATNKVSFSSAGHGDLYKMVERRIHPGWSPNTSLDDDLALVLLDRAPPVAKKAWNEASLAGYGGKPVRAVGYGITSQSGEDSGIKRQVSLVINSVDYDHLYLGNGSDKGICHGDSGGPTFHTFGDGVERLVGIHSYDANGQCTRGADVRIDAYRSFVNGWLSEKEGPQCGDDGQCNPNCMPVDTDCLCLANGVCNAQCPDLTRDPDCPKDCVADGVCSLQACPVADVDCASLGSACQSELVCPQRVCVGDPQHAGFYCSRPCTVSAECPPGMECVQGANVCRFVQKPEASFGQSCTQGETLCLQGTVCTGPTAGPTRCEQACSSNADCEGSATCELGQGGLRYCRAVAKPPVLLTRAAVEQQKLAATGCAAAGGGPLGLLLFALAGVLRRRAP